MTEVMKCCVVYQGRKLLWRTRHSIDVTIVQHCEFDVTEIIAYEPSINVEAKRIYLNSKAVFQKLNILDVGSKQNEVSGSTEFSNNVTNQAISEFILSRLIVSKFNREDGCFEVSLELKRCDGVSWSNGVEVEELVCAKVDELQPYETKNHKLLTHGEVDAALKALEMEQHQLSVSCSEAAAFQAEAHATLLGKEHWWNPIIDTGKAFNVVDTPGSELISSHRKAVTFAKPIVDSSKANLQLNTTTNGGAGAGESLGDSAGRARADLSAPKLYDASSREKRELSGCRNSSPIGNKIGEPLGRNSITPCNSSRLFAGTAASQARAQCAAEDNKPTPKVSRKKILKRANSSRSVHNNSKRSLRVATRSESGDIADSAMDPSADPWASPEADYSALGNNMSGGSAHASFISQVATGLSLFAASVSSKFKSPTMNRGEDDEVNAETQNEPTTDSCFAEGTEPSVAVSRLNSPTTHYNELLIDDESPPVLGIKKQRSKGKRSSYFGAVLEKLIRADSEPESQVFTAEAPSQKLPAPSCSLSIKPCRRASWLPWNLFGTVTVVPIE